ncbi:hypothetical protein PFICI_04562 [Pestalotiopsis fici W106-1]|uniref:ABC transporter n=1 Tax=Pestalotiopsis fici (strain W106-1 / CGMCC3.15140) TaxID=1229662 RepID=W3XBZ2_PESFW|nr:uncharacterized protein PFICI_04562 [Pestalotiopsis fici W106-1]ETS82686.1 hypothetical protein PFICI_04562 [Pestalotiopsis fici W106-1]
MAEDQEETKQTDQETPKRVPTASDYFRIFSYATRWDWCIYAVAVLASLGAGITMPLMNIIFGQLVGQFTDFSLSSSQSFSSILNQQALYIMAIFFVRWALSSINKFCFRMIGIRLSSAIRRDYLEALFAQPIHTIDCMPQGAPATAISTTSNTLQLGVSERLGSFLQSLVTIVSSLVIAFVWSWDLTLVTCSLLLYIIVVLSFTMPRVVKGQTVMAQTDAEATSIASEALANVRLVMAFGAQKRILSSYNEWVEKSRKKGYRTAPIIGIQIGSIYFGMFGAFGLAFWYGTQRYSVGAISNAGVVIVVLMSVLLVLMSLERVSTPLISVSQAMVAACDFFTVIDAPLPKVGSLQPDISLEDIVFDNVTFEYPNRPDAKVLDGLTLRIRNGKNTALVGPSGSGKSTIVGLIEHWYPLENMKVADTDATEHSACGSITVGNHKLSELDPKWWRSQIGLVQQEPFLFNDTIYGNVANGLIGSPWANESEQRKRELVVQACQEAYAAEFIDRLPDGYDTMVGDGGAKLSGGQKQRIAIARCIIKRPKIIILDEATSAIDTRSEGIVQAALDKITQNRTSVTIAHRLSTIKKADHIIVLQKGRAVEEGTHQSLMTDSTSVYRSLVDAQSLQVSQSASQIADTPSVAVSEDLEKAISIHDHVSNHSTKGDMTAEKPPRSLSHNFARILREQKSIWPFFSTVVMASVVSAAGTPMQAWLFAKVITVFTLQGDDLRRESSFWGFMWFALAGGVGLSWLVVAWLSAHVQYSISAAYKVTYMTDILQQKIKFFDQDSNSHGSLSSRIAGDAKHLEELFGMNLALVLNGIFTIIGCVIIALSFSWKLGLISFFVTMPTMVSSGLWKFRHEIQFDSMNSAVFTESSQFATEAINAMRTVSALAMESSINARYRKLLNDHVQKARIKAQWTCAFFGFADSVGLGCQALIFWYGGNLLIKGEFSLEAFFVCYMAIIQGAEAAGQVLSVTPNAAQATAAANRIFDVQSSAVIDRDEAQGDREFPNSEKGVRIDLQDIHFQYPTRDVPIFRGLDLSIDQGQYAAFVGPSGCGKTTIISLLERFYDIPADQGTISCNGADINRFALQDYRQNLSLVSQEPALFRGSVRDNILFGLPAHSDVPDERLHKVCRDAFIHDFITSLPQSYDTDVGQKGVSLSGGQKQRIAIARALIRDPKILLLDEATSALDSESEKVVQAAFEKIRHGRTVIAVAHRLSTVQNADVIFVFDQGSVLEKGTHAELLQKRGVYWDMCQSQATDQ